MQIHFKLVLLAFVFCLAVATPVRDEREPELLKVENERELVLIRKQRVIKEFAAPAQTQNAEMEVRNVQKRMADDAAEETKSEKLDTAPEKSESEAEKLESDEKVEPSSEKLEENEDETAEIMKKSPSAFKKKAKSTTKTTTTTFSPQVVEHEKVKKAIEQEESKSEHLGSEEDAPTNKQVERRDIQPELESLPLESDDKVNGEKRDIEIVNTPIVRNEKEVRQERDVDASKVRSDVFDVNELCDLSSQFNYYISHPTDPTKYIQCDPWGTSEVRTCLNDTIWDSWSYKCALRENIKNITVQFPSGPSKDKLSMPVNCTANEVECLNGGYCMLAYGEPKCVCPSLYTGEFCELNINNSDLYHQILSGNFSIEEFKKRLYEENVTTDKSYYEKYRSKLDNVTYSALVKYLSLYQKDDIRYDTLVTILMEDILDNMYPDAKYLSMFNASSQTVVDMVQMIPSLMSFSKYSLERYDKVFAEFQRVLDKLVTYFKVSIPRIREEANEYTKLTYLFLNKTVQGSIFKSENTSQLMIQDAVSESIRFNEDEVKDSIRDNFNSTLTASTKLFELFDAFQNAVFAQSQINPGILNVTLAESKIAGASEIVRLFDDISVASAQIWDSLVNYGFWYITNVFASVKNAV